MDFQTIPLLFSPTPTHRIVASLSLGGGICQSLNIAVDAAVDAGAAMVVAAGNDGRDACSYSPASSEKAVTVGSTTPVLFDGAAYFQIHPFLFHTLTVDSQWCKWFLFQCND